MNFKLNFKLKDILSILSILVISFYLIPYLLLNKLNSENLDKIGLIIIFLFIFISFSVNLVYVYFRNKNIFLPIITILLSLPLLFLFNFSYLFLIFLVGLFSFLGYFLGNLFS